MRKAITTLSPSFAPNRAACFRIQQRFQATAQQQHLDAFKRKELAKGDLPLLELGKEWRQALGAYLPDSEVQAELKKVKVHEPSEEVAQVLAELRLLARTSSQGDSAELKKAQDQADKILRGATEEGIKPTCPASFDTTLHPFVTDKIRGRILKEWNEEQQRMEKANKVLGKDIEPLELAREFTKLECLILEAPPQAPKREPVTEELLDTVHPNPKDKQNLNLTPSWYRGGTPEQIAQDREKYYLGMFEMDEKHEHYEKVKSYLDSWNPVMSEHAKALHVVSKDVRQRRMQTREKTKQLLSQSFVAGVNLAKAEEQFIDVLKDKLGNRK